MSSNSPKAQKKPHQVTYHGHTIDDPYHWLKDEGYPEVKSKEILSYLEAENAYFENFMKPLQGLKETIFQEIKGRIKDDDSSVPVIEKNHSYFWRYSQGAEHTQWLRTPLAGGKEEVILDEQERSENSDYYKSRSHDISPDENKIVWSEDADGSERWQLLVSDISSNNIHADIITNTAGVAIWAADNNSFLYVELNESLRPYRVLLHTLGRKQADDIVIYEEPDTSFFVSISKMRSEEFFIINSGDHVTSEVRTLPLSAPLGEPTLIAKRKTGHEYDLTQAGDYFYIRSNSEHKNFGVFRAPINSPDQKNWEEIIKPSAKNYIRGISGFKDFLCIEEGVEGLDQISVFYLNGVRQYIEFPEEAYSASLGNTPEFNSNKLRINYTSLVTPKTVYDYELKSQKLISLKVQEIPSGYDASQYACERLMVPARDGVLVPVSIVYKKDFEKDGLGKLHLYGYGAYGIGMSPSFSTARISLLDRGFAYAIAHVRGGDEMGYSWYEDGKLAKRTNTFHDFIDVAHYLAKHKYTSCGNISASGGSAGGSLMGYIANAEPSLWRAIVAHVPFVDILNTMLDEKLPLTPYEWPEWGNPITDKKAFEHILSYSPYDQVCAQNYPAMLVTAGLNDPRVTYWEPAKWVAKLREYKINDNPLLLKTNMGAGHGGKSGRYDSLYEVAEEFAFLTQVFGAYE